MGDVDAEEKESVMYRSIYDYWVYGNTCLEEFLYDFPAQTHEEKLKYCCKEVRRFFINRLNNHEKAIELINDKFNTYKLFANYYKRDVIKIEGEGDYEKFLVFVKKHPDFVVKPFNFVCGKGIRKDSVKNYETPRDMFDKLLGERMNLACNASTRAREQITDGVDLILEELIESASEMSQLKPSSVNSIRITTVKVKDEVNLFHPWIKAGSQGRFADNGGNGGFFAGINPETGIVETDFYDEVENYKNPIVCHPDTNFKIRGFQVPCWNEAVNLVKELMSKLNKINYVGWDLALAKNGWIVIEGNNAGTLLIPGIFSEKGLRKEVEELIGWKLDKQFWWQ